MRNFISSIEKQLRQEQEELAAAEDITEIVFPKIDILEKRDIINPVILKAKLAKLPAEYRDAIYGLCRIATEGGPEGSIIVLDPEKVLAMIEEIELEEKYKPNAKRSSSGKKFILGFSKKVAASIRSLLHPKLAALCHLINDLVVRKIINTPATEKLVATTVKVKALVSSKSTSRSG
jgi:hypothetical protein